MNTTEYDLLVRGGTIVDGTGVARYVGDIAVRDGVIAKINSRIDPTKASNVIEAQGKIVAPGVIDTHTHYDAQVFWDPYCTNSGWHGTTTVVVGNCGFGFMPCKVEHRDRYMLMMENTEQVPVAAMREALPWNWETFPEWMDSIRSIPKGVNIAAYMPLNSLMIYVMGLEAAKTRGATSEERLRMKELLLEAMDYGAIGFGLSYLDTYNSHKDFDGAAMPTDTMFIDDAYFLADVLRERGEGIIQCLAEVPPGKVKHLHVVEELARRSGRPVLMNIITPMDILPGYHTGLLNWLDEMEQKGLNIFGQAMIGRTWIQMRPVDFDMWQVTSPAFLEFTVAHTAEKMTALAGDPEFVARAADEYDPENWFACGGPLETFELVNPQGAKSYDQYKGKLLGDIAAATGKHVVEVFFEIVAGSGALADFRTTVATSTDPDMCSATLRHKRVIPGTSDGGGHVKFSCGGQYSTDNLMWLVRDEERLTLEEMHHRLSYVPARVFGFETRGALLEGMAADIFVYDLKKLGYNRESFDLTYDLPGGEWRRVCRAEGIDWIVVNGVPTFHNNETTHATPGRMIGVKGPEFDREVLCDLPLAAE